MNPYQTETDWHGCYGASLAADPLFPEGRQKPKRERKDKQRKLLGKGLRYAEEVPDPVTHPAKGAPILFNRILDQMLAWGWLKTGDLLADPFGGTGSTAVWWTARHPSNRAVTCEIEARFVAMERATKAHAEVLLGRPLLWTILHGDSRKLDELLSAEVGVTSPPYGEAQNGGRDLSALWEGQRQRYGSRVGRASERQGYQERHHGETPGQIGNLPDPIAITSPPYGKGTIGAGKMDAEAMIARTPSLKGRNPKGAWFKALEAGYVCSDGNIDLCPDVALTSPAYEGSLASDDPKKRGGLFRDPKRSGDKSLTGTYEAPAGAVTSPAYENSVNAQGHGIDWTKAGKATGNRKRGKGCKQGETFNAHLSYSAPGAAACSPPYEAQSGGSGEASRKSQPDPGVADRCGYKTDSNGTAPGQIGAMEKETYADACLAVYSAMARAGIRYCAVVVKNPTRDGKLRRLDKLTARLLRAAGYRIRGWRRAWLWEREEQLDAREGQGSLFDDVAPSQRPKGRLSFFRRLHVRQGAVAAAWEDVFFCELVAPAPPRAPHTQKEP